MDETHPETAPEEVVEPDVTQVADPLAELQQLREATGWWKKAALGVGLAWLVLAAVSFVQYLSASMTAEMLEEAREDRAKARREADQRLQELREIHKAVRRLKDRGEMQAAVRRLRDEATEAQQAAERLIKEVAEQEALRDNTATLRQEISNLQKLREEEEAKLQALHQATPDRKDQDRVPKK